MDMKQGKIIILNCNIQHIYYLPLLKLRGWKEGNEKEREKKKKKNLKYTVKNWKQNM